MKITEIHAYEVELGMAFGSYKSAKSDLSALVTTVIAVATDQGITGWGEVCPYGANYLPALHGAVIPVLKELAPMLLGRDPRMLTEVNAVMDTAVLDQNFVKTGIDYACWDILGQSVGLPVYALLGGRLIDRLPLIGSTPGGDRARGNAIDYYLNKGYRQFSLKIDKSTLGGISHFTEAIRKLPGSSRVIADANQSLSLIEAIEVAQAMADLPVMLEQPCFDLHQCQQLSRKTNLPIILDEIIVSPADVIQAASTGAMQGIGLKIGRCSGLTKAKQICDIADALGITYWVKDVWGSEIATLATAHLAHSRPAKTMAGVLSCMDLVDTRTGTAHLVHENGTMFVADPKPGLGYEPDMAVLGEPVVSLSI